MLLVCLVFAVIVSVNGSFKKVADKVKLQVEAKIRPSMYEDALKPVNSVAGQSAGKPATPSKIERIKPALPAR